MIDLVISGEPNAKQRARFSSRRSGRVFSYTPKKTRDYETYVRELFAFKFPGFVPLEGAVRMTVDIYRGIPKSTSNRRAQKMEAALIRPTTKPDASNVLKSIEDGLNGIAYRDDSQIVEVIAKKYYSCRPRVEISLEVIK